MDFNIGINNASMGSVPFSAGDPISNFIAGAQIFRDQYPALPSTIVELSCYSAFTAGEAPLNPSLTNSEVTSLQSWFQQLAQAAPTLGLSSTIAQAITNVQAACSLALQKQNYSCSQLSPSLQALTTALGSPTENPFNLSANQISTQVRVSYLESWMSSGFAQAQQAINACATAGEAATPSEAETMLSSLQTLLTIVTALGLDFNSVPLATSVKNASYELRTIINGGSQAAQATTNVIGNLNIIINYAENPSNWSSS